MSSAYVGIHERYHHGASGGRMAEYNAESINWDENFGKAQCCDKSHAPHLTIDSPCNSIKKESFSPSLSRNENCHTRSFTLDYMFIPACVYMLTLHLTSSSSCEIYGSNKFFKLSRDMLKRRPTNVIEIIHRQLLRAIHRTRQGEI